MFDKDTPMTLAQFAGLTSDAELSRRVLIDTVRNYMPFFDQAIIMSGNDGTGDKGTVITQYPEGELRAFNEGWGSSNPQGKDIRYASCMVRTRSVVDKSMYETRKANERDLFRFRKDRIYMHGLARQMVRHVFYGNPNENPRDMMGLANIVTPKDKVFGDRVIDAGGTTPGKLTDIWLINWDPEACYLFYPEGGAGPGLKVEDKGEQYVTDSKGKQYTGLVSEFSWDMGLALYDPQRVVRIANVDTSKITSKNDVVNLIDLLMVAKGRLPDQTAGKVAFYMADDVRNFFERQVMNKDNVLLSIGDIEGRAGVPSLSGIPIHKLGTDVISMTGNKI